MGTAASTGGGGSTGVASTGVASTGSASTGAYTGSTGGSTGTASMGWGDDWRDKLAGGNADERKRLERFTGPENVYKSFRELETRFSSGELRSTLKKDATADEVTRWRGENGVPAKPEDYKVTLPDGKPAPKEDDAFLNAIRKSAHDKNFTQDQFDSMTATFYAQVDAAAQAGEERTSTAVKACEDTLRGEWGGDYRVNMAMAEGLLSRAPAGFRDRFMNGFLSDMSPIKANPEAWKWLVQLEREVNPAATVVPGGGNDVGKTVGDELQSIRDRMRTDRKGYDKDEKMQARYRELLDVDAKLKARA